LIVGVYNPEFTISVGVPQDFPNKEDIETLLANLQGQDQFFMDAEGLARRVRVTNVSTSHTGGQPYYYTADISMIAVDNTVIQENIYPDINTQIGVATSVGFNSVNDMPMIFFANGRFWVFYSGNLNKCYYKTSSDGNTWSSASLLSSSFTLGYGGGVLYYPNLNCFYYGFYQDDINTFYWRWGTPNADGSVTWGISEQNIPTPWAYGSSTFDVDSAGNFWTATLIGSGGVETGWAIWKNGVLHDNFVLPGSAWTIGGPKLLVSKSSDSNICFFGKVTGSYSSLYYTTNGGTTWNNFHMPRVFTQTVGDAVVIGNTVYIVYPQGSGGTGNVYFITYNIGDGATSAEQLLGTIPAGSGLCPGVSITTDQGRNLIAVWTDNVSNIYRTVSYDLGVTWDTPKVMVATGGFGYPPTTVSDLASYNQVVGLAYLGPYNGATFPMFAGGATYT
jgi:hypothetical protein